MIGLSEIIKPGGRIGPTDKGEGRVLSDLQRAVTTPRCLHKHNSSAREYSGGGGLLGDGMGWDGMGTGAGV